MKKVFSLLTVLVLSLAFAQCQNQVKEQVPAQGKYNTDSSNIAVSGYDVVSYFSGSEPVPGSSKYTSLVEGVTFQFANAKNKKSFDANPEKYKPQYGGWCAFAVAAKNSKVPTNPKTYKITNGKLYLFFNAEHKGKILNTKPMWNKKEGEFIKQADKNWKGM